MKTIMGRRGTQLPDQHSHYQILHNDSGLCSSLCCMALRPIFGQLLPYCRDSGQSSFYKVRMLAPRPIRNLEGHGASYNPLFVSHTLPNKRSHVLSPSWLTFTISKPRLFWKQCDLQSFLHNFNAFVCVCVGVLVICVRVFTVFLYCFIYVYLFFLCF
jgi:hypothetical protein